MAFNPFLAFGAGLVGGIESAESSKREQQNKIDDEYRQAAIKVNTESEIYAARKKQDEAAAATAAASNRAYAFQNATDTTNAATYKGLISASNSPAIAQSTDVTGEATPAPTNTPQTVVSTSNAAPVQGQGQIQQQNLPPIGQQGGLNSPQGGEITISTPSQTAEQGDNINPLAAPSAQKPPSNLNAGTPFPISDDEVIKDPNGVPRKRSEINQILSLGEVEAKKNKVILSPDQTYDMGTSIFEENKTKLLDKEPSIIYKDPNILKKEADKAGLPYNVDPALAEMSKAELVKNRAADSKAIEKLAEPVVQDATDSISRLNNIVGLGKYVQTGGTSGLPGVPEFKAAFSSEAAEMQKDIAYLTLRNRPSSGYGRVTNADLNMFAKASPSFANPTQANFVIASGLMVDKIDRMAYWRFRQNWISRYGGDDAATIDKVWGAYKDANPIFDPNSNERSPRLNQNRQSSETFFRGKSVDEILANAPENASIPSNMKTNESDKPSSPVVKDKNGNTTFDFSGY